MKILSIGQKNMQNFNGLWGERRPKSNKLEYYPFFHQSQNQIEEEIKDYKGAVTIMAALPFTAKEFYNYSKNRLSIVKQKLIEKYLINKGLSAVIK